MKKEILKYLFNLLILFSATVLASATEVEYEIENWGFCTASNGGVIYVSSSFKFQIEDAQYGFPNTRVIRSWRLRLKDEQGLYFDENTFMLELKTRECSIGNVAYASKLDADEGRDCFIKKASSNGQSVTKLHFIY